ncbi:MAG TPA: putative Ig domain-containing protein [Gemmata sp.]|jgi:hypothetical protein|nr:putative Ig domain-containing protein [Gemmata sp.]
MLRPISSFPLTCRVWQSFLARLFNPSCKRAQRKPHYFRPRYELLEERDTPAVFLVTSTANGVPGAYDGSLRDAILEANSNPGPDTIEFDIEPSGQYPSQFISLTTPLPTLADSVTIDGTSQPGWTSYPLITVEGAGIGFACNGLTTTADGCKIEGLQLQGFGNDGIGLDSNNNVLTGNIFIQNKNYGVEISNAASGNVIGGTTLRASNTIINNFKDGVLINEFSTNNVVEGNGIGYDRFAQTDVDNFGDGVEIADGASNNTIGGTSTGAGNVIIANGNLPGPDGGVWIDATAHDNRILGNKIGTFPDGTTPAGNLVGVEIDGSNNTVGGTTAGAGNVISGNYQAGIVLRGSGTVVQGNDIGTDVTGTLALGNGTNGVEIDGQENTVGGTASGAGNIIAFNQNDGVFVASGANGNAVRQNSIFANKNLGIELGVNPINLNGGLTGTGNNSQAAPTLTSPAAFNATMKQLTIAGTMPAPVPAASIVASAFDFFANLTGESQGRLYLGTPTKFTVGAAKNGQIPFTAVFTFSATTTPSVATFTAITNPAITATFTDPNGNTSQFSKAILDPVLAAPAITSAKTAAFTVTTPGSFTVAASGFPSPIFTLTGQIPKGLTFDRTTGLLSGTPTIGTSGTYTLHFTARNGIGAAVTQTFTLTIEKLVAPVSIPSQVSVTASTKVTALGHDRFEAVFTLAEAATASLTGRLRIVGFSNLPAGVTFDSSTAAAFTAKAKKLTLVVVFSNTTTSSLVSLLAGLTPFVDEIIS